MGNEQDKGAFASEPGSTSLRSPEPVPVSAHSGDDPSRDCWLTIEADAVLYVDRGRNTILCDRLPRPVTLLLKNPACLRGAFLPSATGDGLPTSLADRGGTSAAGDTA